MIYLDCAATSLQKPESVALAVAEAIRTVGNASRGAHPATLDAARGIYETRCKLAKLLGCQRADHVVFTCNSTEALNVAIYGLLSPGEHAVTTDLEHNSVLRPLYDLERRGLSLDVVPADRRGCVDYDDFAKRVRPDTKAVVCTAASNLTGNTLNLPRIAKMAHENGALLIVDASQAAGILPINMEEMGIDVLCFTGHKSLLGPQGTGGLCIRPGVEIRPFKRGGSGVHSYETEQPNAYPTRLEAGTLNAHGLAGLSAALEFIQETGVETLYEREHARMLQFYEGVRGIDGVTVYGDFTQNPRAGIVALNIRDYGSAQVADALAAEYNIAVRAGAHCAPRMHAALGTEIQGAVRFSFSPFTTEAEVSAAIEAVKEMAE